MKDLALVLAAGKGTRMNSNLPKCLHEVAGAPMVIHVLARAMSAGSDAQAVIVGHGGAKLAEAAKGYAEDVAIIEQKEQLGTGHAVREALDLIKQSEGIVTVLYGDTPLIREESLRALSEEAKAVSGPVILGFEADDPGKYGRLLTDGNALLAIREAKDASADELKITLCNSGVLACPAAILAELLPKIDNKNASKEYYLTDIIELARAAGYEAGFIKCAEAETQGVNTPSDLRAVNTAFQNMKREELLVKGIKMPAPESVFFHFDTEIGNDVVIEPNVVFAKGVSVENGAHIHAFTHIEEAHIGKAANIGPFARIRPGTELGEGVKIGNFVETKNAQIADGAKVNHLSYIGDAEIGEASNIGAGTITCNYDGVFKHKTTIGKRVFIGSNASLVAPLRIGDDAMTGSGSVITGDVPAGDLALGRARQENKAGMGKRFMDRLKAMKAKKK